MSSKDSRIGCEKFACLAVFIGYYEDEGLEDKGYWDERKM